MAFTTKLVPYKVFEYSWTSNTPTDYEIDLGGLANTISFIECPDDLSVRLNSTDNDLLEYIEGVDCVVVDKLFITSAEINESVKIYAAWEGS
jgi:hypothetical protein